MSTESNQINQEVKETPEAKTPVEPTPETPQEEKRSPKRDENFRRMEKKMRDLEEKLRVAEETKKAPQEPVEDSDLLTVGQMKKILDEQMKSREMATLEDRLNSKYSDYNQVVSEDAVEELREEHPELFNSIRANPDPYQKAIAAYKLIKNMKGNTAKDTAKKMAVKENQDKIEENRAKPNVAATSGTVLSQATGWSKMTKEQKSQVYQDMKAAAARRS